MYYLPLLYGKHMRICAHYACGTHAQTPQNTAQQNTQHTHTAAVLRPQWKINLPNVPWFSISLSLASRLVMLLPSLLAVLFSHRQSIIECDITWTPRLPLPRSSFGSAAVASVSFSGLVPIWPTVSGRCADNIVSWSFNDYGPSFSLSMSASSCHPFMALWLRMMPALCYACISSRVTKGDGMCTYVIFIFDG